MTPEEHQARHVALHQALDELLADFMRHMPGPWTTQPIDALLTWSCAQMQGPTHEAHVAPLLDTAKAPRYRRPWGIPVRPTDPADWIAAPRVWVETGETAEQLLAAFQSWERQQRFLWTLVGALREYEASQGRYNGLAILMYSRDLGLARGWRDETEA